MITRGMSEGEREETRGIATERKKNRKGKSE